MADWNELTGEGRLSLRPYETSDGGRIAQLLRCPQLIRWMPTAPRDCTAEYAERLIAESKLGLAVGRVSVLGVTTNADGRLIGEVSLNLRSGEVSFWIGSDYWGNGYGVEALRTIIGIGCRDYAISEFRAAILRGNGHSQKVVETCGFRFSGLRFAGHGRDHHTWLDYTCVRAPLSPMRQGCFAGKCRA